MNENVLYFRHEESRILRTAEEPVARVSRHLPQR